MCVELTKHFKKRFSRRVARTKRIGLFTEEALRYGKELSEVESSKYARKLKNKEMVYGTTARLYRGFVYWFKEDVAITVYPIPQKMHHRV